MILEEGRPVTLRQQWSMGRKIQFAGPAFGKTICPILSQVLTFGNEDR